MELFVLFSERRHRGKAAFIIKDCTKNRSVIEEDSQCVKRLKA